jgi:hypothetical protein
MAWSAERRRALFVGANHGSPHRLNDVWEFDLAELAWVLLYAPDLPRSYAGLGRDASDVVFEDGVLRTRRGGPAVVGHTWSGMTYDPRQQRLLFMNTWPVAVDPMVQQVGGDPAMRYRGPPLWAFDPQRREWTALKTPAPWPTPAVGALLQDVPELGGQIWHLNNWQLSATWLLGPGGDWKVIANRRSSAGFEEYAPGRELVGYHDAARRLVITQWKLGTHHFDTRTAQWSRAIAPDSAGDRPDGHDAFTGFYADPASGQGLLVDYRTRELWAYNPDRTRWTLLQPVGDAMPTGRRMLAYMDTARGVFVVIDDLEIWVYRPGKA